MTPFHRAGVGDRVRVKRSWSRGHQASDEEGIFDGTVTRVRPAARGNGERLLVVTATGMIEIYRPYKKGAGK